MKAYGEGLSRNGTKMSKFACCERVNGCYSHPGSRTNHDKKIARTWSHRARAANAHAVNLALAEMEADEADKFACQGHEF